MKPLDSSFYLQIRPEAGAIGQSLALIILSRDFSSVERLQDPMAKRHVARGGREMLFAEPREEMGS
jgi:hypothetical protein